jgi:hypothetical protein
MMRKLFGLLFLAALCGTASAAWAADCPQRDVSESVAQVAEARDVLQALPIGDGQQTDVSPAARQAIMSMKSQLSQLVSAYVRCLPQTVDPKNIEQELTRRTALATKPGPSGAGQPSRDAARYGDGLRFAVRRQQHLLAVVAQFGIECGDDGVLLIFAFDKGAWSEVLFAQSRPYKSVGDAWGSFDYAISPPDEHRRWYVLTKNVAPWCSSTWSSIRYSLLRPVPGSTAPKILLSRSESIWWGGDDFGRVAALQKEFDVRFTAESIDDGVLSRVWLRHFRIDGDVIRRIPPVALSPRDFVDEWIVSPWKDAAEWTAPAVSAVLAGQHVKLSTSRMRYSYSYDTIYRCAGPLPRYQVAVVSDETNEMYYFHVSGDRDYRMDGIDVKPDAACRGPNILEKMSTR